MKQKKTSKFSWKQPEENRRLRFLILAALAILTSADLKFDLAEEDAFTLLFTETFETDGNGDTYRSNTFDDGGGDLWTRWNMDTNPAGPNANTTTSGFNFFQAYSGQQGDYAFGGEDMDASDNPLGTGKPGYVTFETLDISAYQGGNIKVEALFGASTELNSRYEASDYIRVEYAFDSDISTGASTVGSVPSQANLETGTYTIGGAFYGGPSSSSDYTIDANLDGSADSGGSTLSTTLADFSFTFAVPSSASNVSVRITAIGNSAEEAVFDNVRISAEAGGPVAPTSATVAATVFLEGAWNGSSAMNTTLEDADLVAASDPYNGINSHTATASVANAASVPDGVVDWVLVELREAASAAAANDATRVGSAAGFLMSNGSIVATDGSSNLAISLSGNTGSDFYVVIYHRNHLPIMSLNKISESGGTYTIDLSASANVYESANAVSTLSGSSKVGMHAGDIDQDGDIDATDLATWRTNNGATYSYTTNGDSDFNLDGVINAVDRNDYYRKNTSKTRQVPGS